MIGKFKVISAIGRMSDSFYGFTKYPVNYGRQVIAMLCILIVTPLYWNARWNTELVQLKMISSIKIIEPQHFRHEAAVLVWDEFEGAYRNGIKIRTRDIGNTCRLEEMNCISTRRIGQDYGFVCSPPNLFFSPAKDFCFPEEESSGAWYFQIALLPLVCCCILWAIGLFRHHFLRRE